MGTLQFTKDNWNTPQTLEIKGVDNTEKSALGFEKFKVTLGVGSVDAENCNSVGCKIKTPYTNVKAISIDGEVADNENLEIKQIKDKSLISDENGKEAMFFLRPVVNGDKQYVGKKLSCTSSNQKEGKVVFYSEGDVTASNEKKALTDGEAYTLTEKDVTFYIAGQPDEVVDGPINYQVECEFADSKLGAILPLNLINEDRNKLGVVVDTTLSTLAGGRLQTAQNGAGTSFDVKLATQPQNDVIVQVEIKRTSDKEAKDKVALSPSFQKF